MRLSYAWLALVCGLGMTVSAPAATGRIIKVLPEFIDAQGRNSVTPSLYERDAYQTILRLHPAQRSGIRFYVHYKAKGPVWEPLMLRLELRGITQGSLPRQLVLEQPVQAGGWFGRWAEPSLRGDKYKAFGDVTAWRATLWEGQNLLGEQKSFLW